MSQPPSYGQNIARIDLSEVVAAIAASGSFVTSVTGTPNQVTVTPVPGVGAVTISLPSSGTLPGAWHAATGFTVDAGALSFGAAASQIVPGATSLALRNNANSASNLAITDAGISTFRAGIVLTAGQFLNSGASIVSQSANLATGAWFTGGSTTTTKPHVLIEPTGATSTGWSTAGTGLGVNAASGFTGSLMDLQVNGVSLAAIKATTQVFGGATTTGFQVVVRDTSGANGLFTLSQDLNFVTGNIIIRNANGPIIFNSTDLYFTTSSVKFINNSNNNSANGLQSANDAANNVSWTTGLGGLLLLNSAVAGGRTLLTLTPGAHTTVIAEVKDFTVAAHTMTITGGYPLQRFSHFGIPTISAATALTVTTGATVTIEGPPAVAGAGPAAITNPLALLLQAGSIGLMNSSVPTTSPADMVQLFAVDISAGNASLGIRTETAVVTEVVVSDSTLSIKVNGTTYKVLLKA